jgi:hypothetical protein
MTLYEKRGRRYYPVAEYSELHSNSYPHGYYLFRVREGFTELTPLDARVGESRPEFAALAAEMKDAMLAAMIEANKSRPQTPETLTPEQQAAVLAFRKAMGDGLTVFRGASLQEIVEAGVTALLSRVKP